MCRLSIILSAAVVGNGSATHFARNNPTCIILKKAVYNTFKFNRTRSAVEALLQHTALLLLNIYNEIIMLRGLHN